MSRYDIKYDKRFIKNLEKIPKNIRGKIDEAINELGDNPRPHGHKKLQGCFNLYRVRMGDYRICYEIHDGLLIIVLVTAAHRKEVYRSL